MTNNILDHFEEAEKPAPQGLAVLCMLSVVSGSLWLLAALGVLFFKINGSPSVEGFWEREYESAVVLIGIITACMVEFWALYQMAKLRKRGLFLYAMSWATIIIAPIIANPNKMGSGIEIATIVLIALVFSGLYGMALRGRGW